MLTQLLKEAWHGNLRTSKFDLKQLFQIVVITNKAFWVMKQLRNNSETIPASTAEHFWVMNILCCLVFWHNKNKLCRINCVFISGTQHKLILERHILRSRSPKDYKRLLYNFQGPFILISSCQVFVIYRQVFVIYLISIMQISQSLHLSTSLWGIPLRFDLFRKE